MVLLFLFEHIFATKAVLEFHLGLISGPVYDVPTACVSCTASTILVDLYIKVFLALYYVVL